MTTVYHYQTDPNCFQSVSQRTPVKQKRSWLWYFCMGHKKRDQQIIEHHAPMVNYGGVTAYHVLDPSVGTMFMTTGNNPSVASINTCNTVASGFPAPQTSVHLSNRSHEVRPSNFRVENNFMNGGVMAMSKSQPSVVIVN